MTIPKDLPAAARLALPGEEHKRLDPLIGSWRAHMTLHPDMVELSVEGLFNELGYPHDRAVR